MKTWVTLCLSLFTACAVSNAHSAKINLADRFIPFQVNESSVLSGTLETRYVSSAKSIQLKPVIANQPATQLYALLLPTRELTTVTVNSQTVETEPVERRDGKVYMIDPSMLSDGENTIRIDRDTAGTWAGTVMFSLKDSIEEAHFGMAFWEPDTDTADRAPRETPPTTLQTYYDVQWYDLTWKPDMYASRLLEGSQAIMNAKSLVNGLTQVQIDFDMNTNGNGGSPMTLDYVDSGPGTPSLTWSYNSSTYQVTVNLPAAVNTGQSFQVRIGYHGTPNTNAPNELFSTNPYYASTHSGVPVVYSHSQPYGSRRWWPSKDHPSDKATTTVQRIIVPNNTGHDLKAISNGVLEQTQVNGNETTFVWRNDWPIATYLLSIAVSNYIYVGTTYTGLDNVTTMPLGHWIYPERFNDEGSGHVGTLQAMNFFASKFGEYPFIDQKYETATWNITWAIEHQTCTSMPGSASSGVGNGLTRRNIHELAHQWFGDKVTCADWDHLWLQEGMATFCEALFFQYLYGDQYYRNYIAGWNPSSSTPAVGPNSDRFSDGTVYAKGGWIFHMLRGVLGDEAFFQGCRNFLSHGFTTAVSQPPGAPIDLQTAMEQGAGLSAGSLATFFNQWLYSPSTNYAWRPSYSMTAPYDPVNKSVLIELDQHQGLTDFSMPVQVRFTDAANNTTTVKVPAGSSTFIAQMGNFVPLTAELDPDRWILKNLRANINTSSLPKAIVGQPYAGVLSGDSDAGSLSWTKVTGPAWLSISSSGVISGTPPTAGNHLFSVRLTNNSGSQGNVIRTSNMYLVAEPDTPPPAIVINEVLYENSITSDNADTAEYIELYNPTTGTVNIGGWQVIVVSSTGTATGNSITIPGGTTMAAGDYYVIGNASTINPVHGNVVDQSVDWNNALPDTNPSAIVLKTSDGKRVDSLVYRADNTMGSGLESTNALVEGGIGKLQSAAITDAANNVTLGRLPNGKDTNSNLNDFSAVFPSPGSANQGITLPFTDNFNSVARPEWKVAFQDPVRVISPGTTGKPPIAAPAPAGGSFLEVYDSTGGGDVTFLPGAFDKLNVEGFLWIPQGSPSWSTGIGIGTRAESAWFSTTTGFGLEHGFYLEYQNGSGISLKGGRIANAPGTARLLACNSYGSPNVGNSGFVATSLGTPATPTAQSWQPFRIYYDNIENRLFARLGNQTIYDGTLPVGMTEISGGVTIGFRENHTGNPGPSNNEGTWVDHIVINDNTAPDSGVADYYLY